MVIVTDRDLSVIREHKTAFYVLGAALIIAGMLDIVFPFVGTLAVEAWIAVGFAIAGIAQVSHALSASRWTGFIVGLLIGILYLAAAVVLVANPIGGAVTLTLLLAVVLIIGGLFEIAMALRVQPVSGWWLLALSGLIGIAIGGLIWAHLPSSAVWVLGLLLGLNLISSGVAFIGLAAQSSRHGPTT
ncbi:MAG: DUF308 domain-containing protein [Proteobacteria bacterium]|nr:DUF308 domain-containing protein [Pseudomonadota bacterium]